MKCYLREFSTKWSGCRHLHKMHSQRPEPQPLTGTLFLFLALFGVFDKKNVIYFVLKKKVFLE